MPQVNEQYFSFLDSRLRIRFLATATASDSEVFPESVVFLPGNHADADIWLQVAQSCGLPSVVVNWPPHGGSFSVRSRRLMLAEKARFIHELLQFLNVPSRQAILVGHDLDGAVAQLFASLWPLGALVLVDAPALWQDRPAGAGPDWPGPYTRQQVRGALKDARIPSLWYFGSDSPAVPAETKQLLEIFSETRVERTALPFPLLPIQLPQWIASGISTFTRTQARTRNTGRQAI